MNTNLLFRASAITEVLTGLALLVAPLFVIGLLLGEGVSPGVVAVAVSWLLGMALLSVGVAGWEARGQDTHLTTRVGLCIYNLGAAIVLVIIGTTIGMKGILLWPVAILHALIGAMMLWVILSPSRHR
jgi:hypothetical protein